MRYWPLFVPRCRLPVRLCRAPAARRSQQSVPGPAAARAHALTAVRACMCAGMHAPWHAGHTAHVCAALDRNIHTWFSPTAPVACSRGLPRGPPRHFACRLLPAVPLQGHAGQNVRAPPWEGPSEQGALGCAAPVRRARPPSPRPYLCRSGWGRRPRARPLVPVSLEGRAGSGPSRSSEGAHWSGLCGGQA